MSDLNRWTGTGRLCADPELRYTQSGKAVANMRIAVNGRKRADGSQDTLFLKATAWEKTAEVANEYVKKGDRVGLDGFLKLNEWHDKDTGEKRQMVELTVTGLVFLENKREASEETEPAESVAEETGGKVPF